MSAKRLAVLISGTEAGILTSDRHGRFAFRYAESWQERPDAVPLSLSMPLAMPDHPHRTIEAYLWGLLPENEVTLDRWAKEFGVSARNPFALLSHTGEDCAGAAQFVREERLARVGARREEPVQWLTEEEIAVRLRALQADQGEWRHAGDVGQFSLAGGQPKTAFLLRDGRWGIPTGRTPTTHILKPPLRSYRGHVENEHLCLVLARRLGLPAAESEVRRLGGEMAVVITRYDRTKTVPIRRLHQEDLCQALAVPPAKKYQDDGGPSPQRIVATLRAQSSRPEEDVTTFVMALALNWVIGGTDAHAKNYSLLIAPTAVRLAPLYDLSSALPYDDLKQDRLKLAMRVGDAYRLPRVRKMQWRALFAELRLPVVPAMEQVADLAARAEKVVRAVAEEMLDAGLRHDIVSKLRSLISDRARHCRNLLK